MSDSFCGLVEWVGSIDDARIYNVALTVEELAYMAYGAPSRSECYCLPDDHPANIYKLEAADAQALNLKDYAMIVDTWLDEWLWP